MLDYKIVNPFRARLHEKNKKWCPDENIRLAIFVEEHFVERFIQRFTPAHGMRFLKEIEEWIDKNYCLLLFDVNASEDIQKERVALESGTFAYVLFNKTLRFRTCFIPGEDDKVVFKVPHAS